MLKYLTIILTATAILTAAQEEELPGTPRSSYGLGSAAYLEDCNLLYSLFVDTPENCFTEQDREQALQQLGIACDYIEGQPFFTIFPKMRICQEQQRSPLRQQKERRLRKPLMRKLQDGSRLWCPMGSFRNAIRPVGLP